MLELKPTPSKVPNAILYALGAGILMLFAFSLGVSVGERRARHTMGSALGGQNVLYIQRRGDPRMLPFPAPMMPGAHGVFGKIISVSGPDLVIEGREAAEQRVIVTSSTLIRIGRGQARVEDLHPGMDAAVFGGPNQDDVIEARLIRILETQ